MEGSVSDLMEKMLATQIFHITIRIKLKKGTYEVQGALVKIKCMLPSWIVLVDVLDIRRTLAAEGGFVQMKQEVPILSV